MTAPVVLAVTSLIAATVTGALGYGYSSISVPILAALRARGLIGALPSATNGSATVAAHRTS